MKNKMPLYRLVIILIFCIIGVCYYFYADIKLKTTRVQQVYDSQGIQLSKCTMKNNLPWQGTIVKNMSKTEEGTYPLDYYENGVIVKSLHFLNGKPIAAVLEKGSSQGTYKVKIQDKMFKDIDSKAHLFDASNNLIHKGKINENGLLIVTSCPPGKYHIKIFNKKRQYSFLEFNIDKMGSISLKKPRDGVIIRKAF